MNRNYIYSVLIIIIFIFTIVTLLRFSGSPVNITEITLQKAFPELTFSQPVDFQTDNSIDNLIYVVEQNGIIKSFTNTPETTTANIFLDIRSELVAGGEQGLLGLAFHPNFLSNGLFYVDYTAKPDGRTVIAEFKSQNGVVLLNSKKIIFEQPQPFANHNGGQIFFGSDGFLYITLGDGGSGGDPYGNAQNLTNCLGSILRINIDQTSYGKNYSIPLDNPFYNNSFGFKEEIFAYGLRNPWRVSQDPITGKIFAGDVGQNSFEEIDVIESGKNYGWNILEGFSCFNPSSNCNITNMTNPVTVYGRNDGYAVTGGYVYRGLSIKSLAGKYIFGDYGTGKIWSIEENSSVSILIDTDLTISSFGIDSHKELFILDYSSGKIFQFLESNEYSFNFNSNSASSSHNPNAAAFRFTLIFLLLPLIYLKKRN